MEGMYTFDLFPIYTCSSASGNLEGQCNTYQKGCYEISKFFLIPFQLYLTSITNSKRFFTKWPLNA